MNIKSSRPSAQAIMLSKIWIYFRVKLGQDEDGNYVAIKKYKK